MIQYIADNTNMKGLVFLVRTEKIFKAVYTADNHRLIGKNAGGIFRAYASDIYGKNNRHDE